MVKIFHRHNNLQAQYFIDTIFYRHNILQTHYFIDKIFYRHIILQTHYFIDTIFCRHNILQTQYFIDTLFHRQYILQTHYFIDTIFYRHKSESTIYIAPDNLLDTQIFVCCLLGCFGCLTKAAENNHSCSLPSFCTERNRLVILNIFNKQNSD